MACSCYSGGFLADGNGTTLLNLTAGSFQSFLAGDDAATTNSDITNLDQFELTNAFSNIHAGAEVTNINGQTVPALRRFIMNQNRAVETWTSVTNGTNGSDISARAKSAKMRCSAGRDPDSQPWSGLTP